MIEAAFFGTLAGMLSTISRNEELPFVVRGFFGAASGFFFIAALGSVVDYALEHLAK